MTKLLRDHAWDWRAEPNVESAAVMEIALVRGDWSNFERDGWTMYLSYQRQPDGVQMYQLMRESHCPLCTSPPVRPRTLGGCVSTACPCLFKCHERGQSWCPNCAEYHATVVADVPAKPLPDNQLRPPSPNTDADV